MTKRQKNVALVMAICTFILCAIMGIVGFMPTQAVSADYSTPIPSGYYLDENYSVLDITDGDITSTGSTVGLNKAMGDASVVRFKFTLTNVTNWAAYFSVFTTSNYYTTNANEGAFYVQIHRNLSLATSQNSGNIATWIMSQTTRISGSPTGVTYPSWIDLYTQGNSYNIEMGAIKVFNETGVFSGSLVYFEVDGQRLVEYYQNSDLPFTGDNFIFDMNVSGAGQKVNFSQFDLASTDASTATVAFGATSYDCTSAPAEPKPVVTLTTTKSDLTYSKTVSPKYYDVTYSDNDKAGTATATVTFKDKYSGTATATFATTNAFGSYVNPLPDGYYLEDYEIVDIAETYGTDNTFTYTGNASTSTFAASGNQKAMRLKTTYNVGSIWEQNFFLFCNASNAETSLENKGMVKFNIGNIQSRYENGIRLNIISGSGSSNVITTPTFTYPSWLSFNTAGTVHNVEAGAPAVYDASGNYAGVLCYLEINGVRLAEYFYQNSGLPFETGCFGYNANSTNVAITPYDLVTDLTDKVKVEVVGASYGSAIEVEASVLAAPSFSGVTYPQAVEDRYYTVSVGAIEGDTATATLTFKDKYSGTATVQFDVVSMDLVSDTDSTISVKVPNNVPVKFSALEIAGKAFVGYVDNGKLATTISATATDGAQVKFVTVDLKTEAKASTKTSGTRGLRFISSILATDIAILEQYGTVSFGTRITSPDKTGGLDIPVVEWKSQGEGDRDTFTAVLTGFTSSDYATRFTATAYVEITVDGSTLRVYAYVEEEYTRSIAQVAATTLEKDGFATTDDGYDEAIHVNEYNGKYYSYSPDELSYLADLAAYYVAQ